jgi:hypothetical protein
LSVWVDGQECPSYLPLCVLLFSSRGRWVACFRGPKQRGEHIPKEGPRKHGTRPRGPRQPDSERIAEQFPEAVAVATA